MGEWVSAGGGGAVRCQRPVAATIHNKPGPQDCNILSINVRKTYFLKNVFCNEERRVTAESVL